MGITRSVADGCLIGLILLAPTAAGSWQLETLPLLVLLAGVGLVATILDLRERGRPIHFHGLTLGCLVLAGYTVLQVLPLPAGLLAAVSPIASELRTFVLGDGAGTISYEPAATWREAAKLLVYAAVVLIAHERVRDRRSSDLVTFTLIGAGLLVTFVGLLHQVLGIDRLFGFFDATLVDGPMLTTFVNPNHASGFLGFAALTGLGVAMAERPRHIRLGALIAAAAFVATAFGLLSRGGLIGLGLGLLVFTALFRRVDRSRARQGPRTLLPLAVVAVVAVVAGIVLGADRLSQEVVNAQGEVPGIQEKLAAMKDAVPMAADHLATGVGRGAYVSSYTRYKTSALQLTFAFPENILAQLGAEWGVFGVLALVGLLLALVRRLLQVSHLSTLGALAGIVALVAQNLVDFGLEMPGIAIPVAAVLGAGTSRHLGSFRWSVESPWRRFLPILAFGVAPVGLVFMAFVSGDLASDLRRLDQWIGERQADPKTPLPEAELKAVARAHPASALVTVRLAYLAEIADPPALAEAVRWANRTMYLAPTYASGHLLTGRLLIKAGRRAQGLAELKQAWTLWSAERRALLAQVIALAQSPAELVATVPKTGVALDQPVTAELIRLVRRLGDEGRGEWAKEVLAAHAPLGELSSPELAQLGAVAYSLKQYDLALAVIERRLALDPADTDAVLLRARLLVAQQDPTGAWESLAALREDQLNPEELWRARIEVALRLADYAKARDALERLRAVLPTTRRSQVALAQLQAEIETKDGNLATAVRLFDEALSVEPSNVDLRYRRALLLHRLGRVAEARVDATLVARQQPEHAGAQRLLRVLQGAVPPEPGVEPDRIEQEVP
ncbi:MAG: O-antigen ligase family protein [Deltaproteobacteria bacterium]|nr:O-antigen ligase family protein [Deltaproteobacteria bacterium]